MQNNKKKGRRSLGDALHIELERIEPLTDNQVRMFEAENNVVAHGSAGTGKTFGATYLALKDVLSKDYYSRLVYIRSAVPTRDMGFLPGDEKEKAAVYELPYKEICAEVCNRQDAYEVLKQKGVIHFMTTSFIRGSTLRDAVVIVDECQNMSYHELDSIITRVGDNCRIFFCGDMFQADLNKNGISKFYDVLRAMPSFDFIEFTTKDIVRSDLVREYLVTKYETHGTQNVT